jgi:acyl-CoA synthetase (AMP-forming)/AMP-acid ligase II
MGISNFMAALVAGATLQLMPKLDVAMLIAAIQAGEVTHLSLVPTAYQRLCDYMEGDGLSLSGKGLRYISVGGAPLDPTLKIRVERLLGLRLVNGYGMTECAPGSRTRPDRDAPADCIGWPESGVEMKIDGDDTGELLMRSATMMLGYFGAPSEAVAILRPDGWLATGDLARRLPDGSFQLVGRKKEMIIRSGFNVYPAEVEAALNALPTVRESAVLGCKLADGNEEVVAFVQLRDAASQDVVSIASELALRLAPYKRPARIVLVEDFPLGPTGKIAKHKLRETVRP